MSTPRLFTIMGSGETSPTMVKTHRQLFARLGPDVSATVLDTPYGFQENAPELAQRAVHYFRESINRPIEIAGLTTVAEAEPLALAAGLERVRAASYVFSGPGSPTYALAQWAGSPIPRLLADKLADGGAVTFASAAALTLGSHTVPVYEIYKAGAAPHWLEGLDLLGNLGIHVALIPHFDNTEGGHHDTRFCYLGERRLAILERSLPEGTYVLGVDEHTGLLIDLDAGSATVVGNGTVTLRSPAGTTVLPSGSTMTVEELQRGALAGAGAVSTSARSADSPSEASLAASAGQASGDLSLGAETADRQREFDAALAAGDATAAAGAALALEAAIVAWSADTLQSDEADLAHVALRSMILRLAEAAIAGLRDPAETVGPYVEAMLNVRAAVRAEKRYDLSDVIRDELIAVGVEVRDTPAGVVWELRS